MFDIFQKYLEDKIKLTAEEMDLIRSVSIIKNQRKHQYLLQEGDLWHYFAFTCKGCLRTYRVDERGDEHILHFSTENWWTGDLESVFSGAPARSNIDAIEDSTVLMILKENFDMLTSTIPVFNNFVNMLVSRSLVATQNRIHTSISQTAEEKYNDFIYKYPHLVNRVPQHMIASFIGISAETLSRARKQSSKRN